MSKTLHGLWVTLEDGREGFWSREALCGSKYWPDDCVPGFFRTVSGVCKRAHELSLESGVAVVDVCEVTISQQLWRMVKKGRVIDLRDPASLEDVRRGVGQVG